MKRVRRRMTFAMPLVIVTSCSQGAPAGQVPVDAGPPIDAAPQVVGPGKVVLWLSGRLVQPEGYVSCHNFGKNRGCNPPRPAELEVSLDPATVRNGLELELDLDDH